MSIQRLCLLLAGIIAILFILVSASRLVYPFDVILEAAHWRPAELLWSGVNPYNPNLLVTPPYTASPYGPLYYLLLGAGLKIFGHQMWPGRLLAVTAALMSGWLIYLVVRHVSGNKSSGLLAAAVFFSQGPVIALMAVAKSDIVGLCFCLTGLYLAFCSGWKSWLRSALSSSAIACGLLCRPSFVLIPLLCLARSVIRKERNASLLFFVVLGLAIECSVLAFDRAGGGTDPADRDATHPSRSWIAVFRNKSTHFFFDPVRLGKRALLDLFTSYKAFYFESKSGECVINSSPYLPACFYDSLLFDFCQGRRK